MDPQVLDHAGIDYHRFKQYHSEPQTGSSHIKKIIIGHIDKNCCKTNKPNQRQKQS